MMDRQDPGLGEGVSRAVGTGGGGAGPPGTKHPWTVRPAGDADHVAILAVNSESVPGVSALNAAKLARLAAAADPLLVIGDVDGVAGYLIAFTPDADYDGACFRWFRAHRPGSLYIDHVAIGARARRSGAGSALYDAIEAAARERDLDSLTCEVNLDPPNPESMAFHRTRGFHEVGTLAVPDGRTVSLQQKTIRTLM